MLVRDRLRPRCMSAVGGGSTETDTRLPPVSTFTTWPYDEAMEDLLGFGDKARVTGGGEDGRSCDGGLESATGARLGDAPAGSSPGIVRISVEVDDLLDGPDTLSTLHAYAAVSYGSGGGTVA